MVTVIADVDIQGFVQRAFASPWTGYVIAALGAAGIYGMLARRPARIGLLSVGRVLAAAALAGMIVWMSTLHRGRVFTPAVDTGVNIYFCLFAAIALFAAVMAMIHPRPIYCALYFVITILAVAAALLLLAAEFLAVALALVYAGAILVLYVFVIMLAADRDELAAESPAFRSPLAALALPFVLMAGLGRLICDPAHWPSPMGSLALNGGEAGGRGSAAALGAELFTRHVVSLELAGVVLLVGIIGSIALVLRRVEGGSG